MVLLVPDDMPEGANTLAGNVEEMRALYKDWGLSILSSPFVQLLISYIRSSHS